MGNEPLKGSAWGLTFNNVGKLDKGNETEFCSKHSLI